MSALEQSFTSPLERRRAERLAVSFRLAAIVGRGEGWVVDLSRSGARLRHSAPVRRGACVRVSFEWQQRRFSATATVISARVISLGTVLSYESRVHFSGVDAKSEKVLSATLDAVTGANIRRWVANLRGWSEESLIPAAQRTGSFIRCRYYGWWERKYTSATEQPESGFLLPADTTEKELATLCETYARAGDEERGLIRLLAAAAVAEVTTIQ